MKRFFAILIVVCASPVVAQTNDVSVWLSSQMNDKGGRLTSDEDVQTRFDGGSGYGVSLGHMFASHLSGELAVFRTSTSATLRTATQTASLGDIKLTAITAMLQYHFLPGRRVDVYAGGGGAYVMTKDLDSADLRALQLAPVSLDNKTTWTLGGGLTLNVSPRVGIALDARYIPMKISGHAAGDNTRLSSDLNPLLISAGLKVRF